MIRSSKYKNPIHFIAFTQDNKSKRFHLIFNKINESIRFFDKSMKTKIEHLQSCIHLLTNLQILVKIPVD